jgi:integrase
MSTGRMNVINWVLEPDKFLSLQEARMLLKTARVRAETAIAQGHKIPVRDYFIIDLALSTGLRVMEIAQLNCGDIFIQNGVYSLLVRRGKGGKKRLVRFDEFFK